MIDQKRERLADLKGVTPDELYCGNCEFSNIGYGGFVSCAALFDHAVEEFSYCSMWSKKPDLVEVVRCKNCKYYLWFNEKCQLIDTRLHFYETDKLWTEDSYCAWGERKE